MKEPERVWPGDIRKFDIAGEMVMLDAAIDLAMINSTFSSDTVSGWEVNRDNNQIILIQGSKRNPTFADLDKTVVKKLVERYLEQSDYGQAPDTDGHTEKGFRLFNDRWNKVGDNHKALFAVEPHWVVYGK